MLQVIESDTDVADVGDTWRARVFVTDNNGLGAAPDSITCTVTKPDTTTAAATVTAQTVVGLYLVTFPLATAGRYTQVGTITSALFGGDVWQLEITARAAGVALPVLADVRGYLDRGGQTVSARWQDAELQAVLDSETAHQRAKCRQQSSYPKDLRDALLRRVQVALAYSTLPLAMSQGDAEAPPQRLGGVDRDPEVRRLEAPYRRLVMG